MNNKKRVAVLFGGRSTEHEVSRKSAYTILTHMPEGFEALPIGITKAGAWFAYHGDLAKIPTGEWENSQEKHALSIGTDADTPAGLFYIENGEAKPLEIDVFFPVLHGMYGEDGTVQGLFELLGVPYVGCGVGDSAVSMDKSMTKLLVSTAGIRQADFVFVDRHNKNDLAPIMDESERKLGYPVFVKPCKSGSSVGVTKATDRKSLEEGLAHALRFDDRILIEDGINARELECAVLETKDGFVAEVGEVVSAIEFYDYDAKYNNPSSQTVLYPDVSPEIEAEIQEKAVRIFKLLDCKGLSRVDFFLDRDTGEVVFNEINTLPGFTNISMFPMLMKKHGLSIEDVIKTLVELVI